MVDFMMGVVWEACKMVLLTSQTGIICPVWTTHCTKLTAGSATRCPWINREAARSKWGIARACEELWTTSGPPFTCLGAYLPTHVCVRRSVPDPPPGQPTRPSGRARSRVPAGLRLKTFFSALWNFNFSRAPSAARVSDNMSLPSEKWQ